MHQDGQGEGTHTTDNVAMPWIDHREAYVEDLKRFCLISFIDHGLRLAHVSGDTGDLPCPLVLVAFVEAMARSEHRTMSNGSISHGHIWVWTHLRAVSSDDLFGELLRTFNDLRPTLLMPEVPLPHQESLVARAADRVEAYVISRQLQAGADQTDRMLPSGWYVVS